MPSTYTQNLGIEEPATGEQANTWGLTVNRNMETLDTAINGNIHLALSTSPYQLTINNGADKPVAANPVIIWTGTQTAPGAVHIDWQSSRQHFYSMSNQTTGGFAIAFAQGSGTQFTLQAGYDALLYSDGGGAGANVAAALASPQFTNLLATGAATVQGSLTLNGSLQMGVTTITADAQGNVHLSGGLGVGAPTSIPDPLTVSGLGYGQLRLAENSYGVIFRNDDTSFYLMITAAGDPYGPYAGAAPLIIDLASRGVGLGGVAPIAGYALNTSTLHATGAVRMEGLLTVAGGVDVSGPRNYFRHNEASNIGLEYPGAAFTWIGTNASGQFQVSNANAFAMLLIDQAGNAMLGGGLHVMAGGVQFPDGSIQTTAAVSGSFPGNITVSGVINGPAAALQSPVLYCPAFSGTNPSGPANSVMFTYNPGSNFVTLWVIKSDGSRWIGNVNLAGPV